MPLPSTEIATALQTGLVEALGSPPQVAVISQFFNNAKNMTDLRWQLLLGATLITKSTWDKIPADVRPALLQATQEAGARLRKEIRDAEARDVEAMKKRGLNVVPVSAAQRAQWLKLTESLYPSIRGKIVPAEAFDEAMRYRDEYRKQRGAAGSERGQPRPAGRLDGAGAPRPPRALPRASCAASSTASSSWRWSRRPSCRSPTPSGARSASTCPPAPTTCSRWCCGSRSWAGCVATREQRHLTLSTAELFGEGSPCGAGRVLAAAVSAATVGRARLRGASASSLANREEDKLLPGGVPVWLARAA